MFPFFRFIVAAGLMPLIFVFGCQKADKIISYDDDAPEMAAAIAKARHTLPQFWQRFEHHDADVNDFALKVRICDKADEKIAEHFWLINLERKNGKIYGTINNDPETIHSVKLGQRMEIPEADITDWLYMRRGKMVGNVTLRVLFKNMPAEDVAKCKKMFETP
jgi:uncharacterized protein YegJ (DUF2314 family)